MNPALLVTVENLFSNSDNKNIPLQLIQQIALDEGLELNAYQDEFGKWTIGFGHTPAQPGEVWTVQQAYDNLINDINNDGINPVDTNLPWSDNLGIVRQSVLYNMSYNEGINNLLDFTDTLASMQNGDILGVLNGMKDSDWYDQVTTRARQLMFQYWQNTWMIYPLTSKQDSLLHNYLNGIN